MTTQAIGQTTEGDELVAVFRAAAPESRDRKFWITLSLALLIHLSVLIGLIRSPTRQMGDPNSPSSAVAVSFVTEAELQNAATGSDGGPSGPPPSAQPPAPTPPPPQPQAQPQPETPPAPPQPEAAPPEPQPAPPEPKAEVAPEPAPKPPAEDVAKPEEKPVTPEPPPLAENTEAAAALPKEKPEEKPPVEAKPKPPEKKVDDPKDLAKEMPDLLQLPDPSREARERSQQQPARKQQKQAMRAPDMTLPGQQNTMMQSDGRSAGVERPAGITRSGANDDFARGVIRALRATMPQMNALGRTTVRIIINQNGNIESVEVLARSENTDLNRAIVFSTKQASFPFPPNGATVLDRTFTITYIYH